MKTLAFLLLGFSLLISDYHKPIKETPKNPEFEFIKVIECTNESCHMTVNMYKK